MWSLDRDNEVNNRDDHVSGLKPILVWSGLDKTASFWKLADQALDRTDFNHINLFSCESV